MAPGYGLSYPGDTPRGEAANLPRMLREATARQTRFAAEQGVRTKGGDAPTLAVDHKAGDHLVRLQRVVARMVLDTMRATDSAPQAATWGAVARWLDTQMPVVRVQVWAPTTLADLRRVVASAERYVDRPPTRLYLGPCDKLTGDETRGYTPCEGEYRGVEGESTATCTCCRSEVDVVTRRGQLRDQAQDLWLTAVECERLTAFLGMRVPDSTVSAWHKRGQITGSRKWSATPDPAAGPVRYLLRDVLGIVEAREAKTRRTA